MKEDGILRRPETIRSGIYCIENKNDGKKYIGQARDIIDRWYKHRYELTHNIHFNNYLQNSWNKHGEDGFCFYVLEYCEPNELNEKEIYYIDLYDTTNRSLGYNLKSGGQIYSIYTDEAKQKMSKSVKASYDEALRKKRSEMALKQWENPEIKDKISGKNSYWYGKHMSDETKKKLSESKKGKVSHRRDKRPVRCVELNLIFEDATIAGKEENFDSSCILKVCKG